MPNGEAGSRPICFKSVRLHPMFEFNLKINGLSLVWEVSVIGCTNVYQICTRV